MKQAAAQIRMIRKVTDCSNLKGRMNRLSLKKTLFDCVHKTIATPLSRQSGFTLIETVITITILGILSIVVVSNFESSSAELQKDASIRKIASDLRYARDMAMTSGTGVSFVVDQANNSYSILWDGGAYMKNPVTGSNFVVELGKREFSAVSITATGFSGGILNFSPSGLPTDNGSGFAGQRTLLTINNKSTISVVGGTGLVRVLTN